MVEVGDTTGMKGLDRRVRAEGEAVANEQDRPRIRQSLALGYRPLAYEETAEQRVAGDPIDTREEAEATNLAAVIGHMPQARFLIYVGYSHATKVPLIDEAGQHTHLWMAGRLQQKTGIDPLTIDQTGLGETNSTLASRTLRDVVLATNIARSVILFGAGKPLSFGRYRDHVDLQVIHPATHVVHGRPDWLLAVGRHPVPPDPKLIPSTGRVLAQAFLANEGADAIPVDEVVLEAGAPRWLMLPDQPVRIVVSGSTSLP